LKKVIIYLLCSALAVFILPFLRMRIAYGQVRDTIEIGLFLKAIDDFSPQTNSFGANFYVWSNSKIKNDVLKQVEIVNLKSTIDYDIYNGKDSIKKSFVSFLNYKSQLSHDWNLFKYPFDIQKFKIKLESQNALDYSVVRPDENGFKIAKDFYIPGWKLKKYFITTGYIEYPVDFGYSTKFVNNKKFNQIVYHIETQRNGWGLYFTLFSSLYLAFFVSFLAFYIRADNTDPRFGVSVGGLFAAVANKYVVDSNIPQHVGISIVDIVHFINFLLIFLTLIISSISLSMTQKNKLFESRKLDKKMAKIFMITYLTVNLLILLYLLTP